VVLQPFGAAQEPQATLTPKYQSCHTWIVSRHTDTRRDWPEACTEYVARQANGYGLVRVALKLPWSGLVDHFVGFFVPFSSRARPDLGNTHGSALLFERGAMAMHAARCGNGCSVPI
jgi:hypothetical protein